MQALMLIDVQNAFLDSKWGKRNNPNAEQKMLRLLQHLIQIRCFIKVKPKPFKQGLNHKMMK